MTKPKWLPYAFLILALAIGALARFWRLTDNSLFIDEAYSVFAGSLPLSKLFDFLAHNDAHPPLFYLYAHAAIATLHWQPWSYRFLTAPLGLITIVATWGIARRVFGDTAAAFAALFVAISPDLIDWDRMFRMYSMLVALSTLSWWLLLLAQDARGKALAWLWAAYCVCAALLPSVQYLGGVVVLSQVLYALPRARQAWPVFAGAGLALLALAPWLGALRTQYAFGGHVISGAGRSFYWLGQARGTLFQGVPVAWFAGTTATDWAMTVFALGCLVAGCWIGRKSIVPYWLSPIAIQAAAAFALGKDLVIPRYLLAMIPAFDVCLGAIVALLLGTRWRIAGIALVSAFATLSIIAALDNLLDPFYQRTDWYAVDIVLLRSEKPSDAIVIDQGFAVTVLGGLNAFQGHDVMPVIDQASVAEAIRWIDARPRQRIWYVENQYYYPDPKRAVYEHLRATRPQRGGYVEQRADDADRAFVSLFDVKR